MDIVQALPVIGKKRQKQAAQGEDPDKPKREKRVGRCTATFHVTPKAHHKEKEARLKGTKA